jgi:ribosome production factor 2
MVKKGKHNPKKRPGQGKGPKGNANVKTVAELGIAAQSFGIKKRAKTNKGRRMISRKEAKVVENPKKSILIKGRKSSEVINSLLQELHKMRGADMSKLFGRKHDFAPFEDSQYIETQAVKYDSSLFAAGSHQKKRPHNLVFGRVFNSHVLDMFEFGVENYRSLQAIKADVSVSGDLRPILVFQGEPFEMSETHKRLKNLMIDFFRITDVTEGNISEMRRVIVFTCTSENVISF